MKNFCSTLIKIKKKLKFPYIKTTLMYILYIYIHLKNEIDKKKNTTMVEDIYLMF